MARETVEERDNRLERIEDKRLDKEWREVAIEALKDLTGRVADLELENAVMKVKLAMIIACASALSSAVTAGVLKWITSK